MQIEKSKRIIKKINKKKLKMREFKNFSQERNLQCQQVPV